MCEECALSDMCEYGTNEAAKEECYKKCLNTHDDYN